METIKLDLGLNERIEFALRSGRAELLPNEEQTKAFFLEEDSAAAQWAWAFVQCCKALIEARNERDME